MRTITLIIVTLSTAAVAAQRPVPSHEVAGAAVQNVATVNGVPLTSLRLDAALNALIPFESFHRGIAPERLDELRRKALDQIIDEELEYQEGVQMGVRIPAERIQREVSAIETKYGGRPALEAALAGSRSTLSDLRRELQRSLTAKEALRLNVTEKCQVTREDASAYFTANPERFVVPEQLHLSAITIGVEPSATPAVWSAARTKAEDVRRRLVAGASFAEMARTYSTDAATRASGGDMGMLHRGSLTDEFERAARGLPLRQPSEVVKSLYGFHIIQIDDITPPGRKAFADVATALQKDLTTTRCDTVTRAWLSDLRARATVVMAGKGR